MKFPINKILILFFFLFAGVAAAQNNYEDVVYLKNGSIIHGIIIEQIPNESIKIQTKDKNVFVFKMDEVMKITKEEIQRTNIREPREVHYREDDSVTSENIKKEGFTNITEFNFGMNTQGMYSSPSAQMTQAEEDLADLRRGLSFGVQTINGYQFNPYLSTGIGIGFQTHTKIALVPIFLELRGNFIAKRTTPFVGMSAGYAYTMRETFGFTHIGTDHKGGLMLTPSAGIKFFVKPKMALNLSLAYRYQEIALWHEGYTYYTNTYPERYSKEVLRLYILRFGFTF